MSSEMHSAFSRNYLKKQLKNGAKLYDIITDENITEEDLDYKGYFDLENVEISPSPIVDVGYNFNMGHLPTHIELSEVKDMYSNIFDTWNVTEFGDDYQIFEACEKGGILWLYDEPNVNYNWTLEDKKKVWSDYIDEVTWGPYGKASADRMKAKLEEMDEDNFYPERLISELLPVDDEDPDFSMSHYYGE